MRKTKIFVVAIVVTIIGCYPGYAQRLLESYVARLSERDHFNSNGQRLTTAAAIIRQDRANYHRFGIRDAEDEDDKFFADEGNRAILERLLEHGRAESGVISRIVNGTPVVRVEVWQGNDGSFIVVTLIGSSASVQENASSPNTASGDAYYYYVANTRPPDAFLALRTQPSASSGQRIMAMTNGTLLQVLQRLEDGWWYVRVKATGDEGWALSGQGDQSWIVCCAK